MVRFVWVHAWGTSLGPDGDPFDPSEDAALPTDDALGAWHPHDTIFFPGESTPRVSWRRCFRVLDYEAWVAELERYLLLSAQEKS